MGSLSEYYSKHLPNEETIITDIKDYIKDFNIERESVDILNILEDIYEQFEDTVVTIAICEWLQENYDFKLQVVRK
jgi:hypothetical protein